MAFLLQLLSDMKSKGLLNHTKYKTNSFIMFNVSNNVHILFTFVITASGWLSG